jgi:hypothetical protein
LFCGVVFVAGGFVVLLGVVFVVFVGLVVLSFGLAGVVSFFSGVGVGVGVGVGAGALCIVHVAVGAFPLEYPLVVQFPSFSSGEIAEYNVDLFGQY